jgi:hypothetical protein
MFSDNSSIVLVSIFERNYLRNQNQAYLKFLKEAQINDLHQLLYR